MKSMPLNVRDRRTAGFSLLEISISALIISLVIGSVAVVGKANREAYEVGAVKAHLEAQTLAAIERVVVDLSIAGSETIEPDPGPDGNDSITYLQALGMENNEVTWSGPRQLRFEYEIGELDDGLDNNGNGLVDEGRVVLIEDVGTPEERVRVVTRWVREYLEGEEPNGLDDNANGLVDERGFVLERAGGTLTVRLSLERAGPMRRLLRRSARTSIRLRN